MVIIIIKKPRKIDEQNSLITATFVPQHNSLRMHEWTPRKTMLKSKIVPN